MKENLYYTASEAQAKLKLSKTMFHKQVKQGLIPKVILPGMKQGVYPKRDIDTLAISTNLALAQETFSLVKSTPADLMEELHIDARYFGRPFTRSLPERIAFQQKNEYTFLAFKVRGQVVGYLSLFRCTDQVLDALLKGYKIERDISLKDILSFERLQPFSIYLGNILIDPALATHLRRLYAGLMIVQFIDMVRGLVASGYQIEKLYTTTTTQESDDIARKLGLREIKGKSVAPGHTVYEYSLDDEGFQHLLVLRQRFQKGVRMLEERKLVTILFADVVNSTALGERLDPEDIRMLMERYYAVARRVISLHGGFLEKFIGDAVLAVFGLPHAYGDDAERALAASIVLQKEVATDPVLRSMFQLRVGINTGEVIATNNFSQGDFLVTGDAVNVATRLQQNAQPGEILVGERTAGAAQAAFLFDEGRFIEVKGKHQPLKVYALKRVRPVRQISRPPLVGRKQDMLQLSVLQARVLEEQRPQLVSIVAPAGTGKTRLVEEFLHRLDPAEGFQVATARCLPYGETMTYWPLRDLLTGLLGEEISKQRVIAIFCQGGYQLEDASHLADLVLATLGIEGTGADRQSIFMAWQLLIEVFAKQAPRIIIFDDLQWASDSLLNFIESILHMRTQAPLLFIALSRPELLDRRPTWGGGQPNFTALALQPLTPQQTQDLVKQLATDLPETTRNQIGEHSGGNPFFALELIRGLHERTSFQGEASSHVLPDTVHAAVLARLDLLSLEERRVLQVASVASRAFQPSMLQAVLEEYHPQQIDTALEGLLGRDLIIRAEGGTFIFRHILIRDVAYGTLSRAERIRIHRKIAIWLENSASERLDEFTELLAYHYREVVQLARLSSMSREMPADRSHALHFLKRAAELASRAGAFAEAFNHLQNAIELATESERTFLYEQMGDSMPWGDTSFDAYQKALEYAQHTQAELPLLKARLLRKLLIVCTRGYVTRGPSSEEMVALRIQAQQLAEAAGDEDELWRIRIVDLFWPYWDEQVPREEIELRRKDGLAAAAYFEQRHDWSSFSEALDGYASLSARVNAFDDVLAATTRRLQTPQLSLKERGDAYNVIASVYYRIGNYSQCIATIQEALAQRRPGESLVHFGAGPSLAIGASFLSGRWGELNNLFAILKEIWEQIQHDPASAFFVVDGYFSILQLALAREDRALADAAISVFSRVFPDSTSKPRLILSAYREDDPLKINFELSPTDRLERGLALAVIMFFNEHGVHSSDSLLSLVSTPSFSSDVAFRCHEIAQALAANDNTRLAIAIDEAEKHHLIVHAARMRIILAQRIKDRTQLERARTALEGLGDRQFLRRLEEIQILFG